jgi:hypothetical protein
MNNITARLRTINKIQAAIAKAELQFKTFKHASSIINNALKNERDLYEAEIITMKSNLKRLTTEVQE